MYAKYTRPCLSTPGFQQAKYTRPCLSTPGFLQAKYTHFQTLPMKAVKTTKWDCVCGRSFRTRPCDGHTVETDPIPTCPRAVVTNGRGTLLEQEEVTVTVLREGERDGERERERERERESIPFTSNGRPAPPCGPLDFGTRANRKSSGKD